MASAGSVTARTVSASVTRQDLAALKSALKRHRGAPPPQAVMNAGRLAWLPGLKLLKAAGADLNAGFRNYRAELLALLSK